MTARILCALLIALEIRGLLYVLPERSPKLWAFYTLQANLAATLSSLLVVIFGPQAWLSPFRYLAVCMMAVTIAVVAAVLVPMRKNAKKLLFSGYGLYQHLLCPLLTLVCYIFFEEHAAGRLIFLLPAAVTLLYGVILLRLNYTGKVDGPYPFLRVRQQKAGATVLWMCGLMASVMLISLMVRLAAG